MWLDLLVEARDGILAHRVRSLLSTLGILFGVAAVIGILSIGEGARREQEALIAQLGILNVQVRAVDLPDDPERAAEIRRKSLGLTPRDVVALRGILPAARAVGGMREVDEDRLVPRPAEGTELRIVGAEPGWLAGTPLRLLAGRPLTDADERATAPVCLLGTAARRALFGASPALGEKVRVGEAWLTVVGIVEPPGGAGSARVEGAEPEDNAAAVFLPLATAYARLEPSPDVPLTEVQITMASVDEVEGAAAVARRALARLHREQPDTTVVIPLALLEQSRAQQRIFNLVMGLIAGISLLVGGIGIMNIMLASVLERTREIGVRLAVGATPADIRALFLAEASLISLVGGALGIVAGFGIAFAVGSATGWATAVSAEAVAVAALVSMAEGVVFGFVPARRASRLPPAIALRSS